jgi:hypothetical protein
VYSDLRDRLVGHGLPRDAIRFIHEAKTDRDKAQLFAACRAGSIAVLIGSTEKMGVGTNVQDRAIALPHLDAPWRPADVAQREGRIIRQGNLNAQVQILRYVTTGSFDGYMWQTLQRKAAFISQVMHGRLDAREIADIGDTALSFSEVKALATGNPLLMDKAEADAALARLQRAERAHYRNQDALRHGVTRHEKDIATLTQLGADLDAAIAQREDTRGNNFTMIIGDHRHTRRTSAGEHLKKILEREVASLDGRRESRVQLGRLADFPLTGNVERSMGTTLATISFDGAPRTALQLLTTDLTNADPGGLITRLENRIGCLEEHKTDATTGIEHARQEITHATDSIGQPFPHAAQLTQARERAHQIDEELQRMAAPPQQAAPTETCAPIIRGSDGPDLQPVRPGTAGLRTPPAPSMLRPRSIAQPGQRGHSASRHGFFPRPASHDRGCDPEPEAGS